MGQKEDQIAEVHLRRERVRRERGYFRTGARGAFYRRRLRSQARIGGYLVAGRCQLARAYNHVLESE